MHEMKPFFIFEKTFPNTVISLPILTTAIFSKKELNFPASGLAYEFVLKNKICHPIIDNLIVDK
jgi:hypothetical protein